jgi:DNA-directed RNA polymerase specialized sigma24 family protein
MMCAELGQGRTESLSPDDHVSQCERRELVGLLRKRLSPTEFAVLALSYINNLTLEEISHVLSRGLGPTCELRSKARAKAAEILRESGVY